MSRHFNACCILATAALSIVSCSTLLPSRSSKRAEVIVDTTSVTSPIDSLAAEQVIEDLPTDLIAVEDPEMTPDSLEVSSITSELFQEAEQYEAFHFDESQSKGVMIDEFRNTVIDDIELDLSEWDSHYPADGHVTSPYGWRGRRMHGGLDIKAYVGDNLYAAFDGVVRLSKYYSSFGYCIIIRHYNGLETLYAHASKLLVKVNDQVKAGDVIAYAGNTGRSTGSHLHFEVRAGGNHFNPKLILDTDKRKIKDGKLFVTMRNGRLFASNNESEEEREAYILQQISIKYHIVRSGDILSRIAANNGTTVATICRLNGIKSTSVLRIGQRLIVRDGIRPKTTTKTTSTAKPTTSSSTTAAATSTSSSTYRVKRGDTLSEIAKNHGTTVSAICALNGITSRTTLQIGQRLKVNGTASSASSSNSFSAQYYTVKSGDTLSVIAKRHGTTVSKLCQLNGIRKTSTLQIKQRLRIR